jgi:hypothetical protein
MELGLFVTAIAVVFCVLVAVSIPSSAQHRAKPPECVLGCQRKRAKLLRVICCSVLSSTAGATVSLHC